MNCQHRSNHNATGLEAQWRDQFDDNKTIPKQAMSTARSREYYSISGHTMWPAWNRNSQWDKYKKKKRASEKFKLHESSATSFINGKSVCFVLFEKAHIVVKAYQVRLVTVYFQQVPSEALSNARLMTENCISGKRRETASVQVVWQARSLKRIAMLCGGHCCVQSGRTIRSDLFMCTEWTIKTD